jgi:hypothetical protein
MGDSARDLLECLEVLDLMERVDGDLPRLMAQLKAERARARAPGSGAVEPAKTGTGP